MKKLPGPKGLLERGMNIPLNVFLMQEIKRMQKILTIVRTTCQQIVEAIDGQIIMTPSIVNAIDSIADAKVPNTWIYDATGAEISWLLPNLGGWIGGLSDRNA
jgi:dynein heavy chain